MTQTSRSMGDLLLQGWCMLSDSCEGCLVPLMRSPSGDETVCCQCGTSTSRPSVPPKSPDVRELTPGGLRDAGEAGREPASCRRRSVSPSTKLAERMLEGWNMLGSSCPICMTPLCEEKGSRRVECVSCELEVRTEGRGNDSSTMATAATATAPEREVEERRMKEQEPVSVSLLGERVLRRVLTHMDELAGRLSVDGNRDGLEEDRLASNLLGRLATCADIVAKLNAVRL